MTAVTVTGVVYRSKFTPYERVIRRLIREGGCNVFPGAKYWDGYGMVGVYIDGKRYTRRAHRIVWEHHHGPIPEGLELLHSCDNPPCCEITHLKLGTHGDNVRDMIAKGRKRTGWERRQRDEQGRFA